MNEPSQVWHLTEEPYPSVTRRCLCGEPVCLFFNGGELDDRRCKCGRSYRLVATNYAIEMYAGH